MNDPYQHQQPSKIMINTNTYVSLGLIMLIAGGIWAILTSISGTKSEVGAVHQEIVGAKIELNAHFDKMEDRVTKLEGNKSTVTSTEFYKWAIHLQQANPQIKVPEPEIAK